MHNPFADLGNSEQREVAPDFESVRGAFTCQVAGCWDTVGDARYYADEAIIEWDCGSGHKNSIKDFYL